LIEEKFKQKKCQKNRLLWLFRYILAENGKVSMINFLLNYLASSYFTKLENTTFLLCWAFFCIALPFYESG